MKRPSKILCKLISTLLCVFLMTTGCSESEVEKSENETKPKQVYAYDLNNPKDKVLLYEKLQSDVTGKKTYVFTDARVFGVRPDKTESLEDFGKELFRYSSCEIKVKRVLEDGNIEGKSKSARIYQDSNTNEYIEEIANPYAEGIIALPIYISKTNGGIMTPNGPITGFTMKIESTAIGQPLNIVIKELENQIQITRHSFTKWYSKANQAWRTRMGMDTYYFDKKYIMNRSYTHIPSIHMKMSQDNWLPQFKLSDSLGHMTYTSNVSTFSSKEELPKEFVSIIEEQEPDFFDAPIVWDEEN